MTEVRRAELEKLKETRKKEHAAAERQAREEFGAAPTEMIQNHRNQLLAIDEQMLTEQQNTEQVGITINKIGKVIDILLTCFLLNY